MLFIGAGIWFWIKKPDIFPKPAADVTESTPVYRQTMDVLYITQTAVDVSVAQKAEEIQITNTLGFNLRTYILFLLLLFGKEIFWFLFVCIVLEGLKYAMMARYETVAGRISAEFFPEDAERSGRRKGGNGR